MGVLLFVLVGSFCLLSSRCLFLTLLFIQSNRNSSASVNLPPFLGGPSAGNFNEDVPLIKPSNAASYSSLGNNLRSVLYCSILVSFILPSRLVKESMAFDID